MVGAFGAIMLAEEFVAQGFHAHGERLDLARVVAPGNHRRDGDEQAEERGVQGDADPLGEAGMVVGRRLQPLRLEQHDEAENRAHQPHERGDADDDFQDDQAAFELAQLESGAGFDQRTVFVLGHVEVVGREQQQARDRRGILRADALEEHEIVGAAVIEDSVRDGRRHHLDDTQGQGAFDDEGDGGQRRENQRDDNECIHVRRGCR